MSIQPYYVRFHGVRIRRSDAAEALAALREKPVGKYEFDDCEDSLGNALGEIGYDIRESDEWIIVIPDRYFHLDEESDLQEFIDTWSRIAKFCHPDSFINYYWKGRHYVYDLRKGKGRRVNAGDLEELRDISSEKEGDFWGCLKTLKQ